MAKRGKTHIILSSDLVEELDKIVERRKRSQFIMEAVKEKLERMKLEIALERAAGAWQDNNHPDLKTQEDINRYLRGVRTQGWNLNLQGNL